MNALTQEGITSILLSQIIMFMPMLTKY